MDQKTLTKQTLSFYWKHVRRYPKYIAGIVVTVPFAVLCLAFLPNLIIANILQRISTGDFERNSLSTFVPELVVYAAVILVGGVILWRVAVYFAWKLETLVLRSIHREIFDHLLSMSMNFHANRFSGSLVSQANKLASSYANFADALIYQTTTLVLAFIFAFVILLPRAPWIAVMLIVFATAYIIAAIYITRPVRELRKKEAAAETKQTGRLADSVSNIMAIKSFAGGGLERKLYGEATDTTQRASMGVLTANLKQDSILAASTLSISVCALVATVASVVYMNADVGTAFLVVTYTANITIRLWDFSRQTLRTFNRSMGDAQEMIQMLSQQPEVKDPPHPEKPHIKHGQIEFQNMQFTHPDSHTDETLFTGLSMDIKSGEKIGLVGQSGSGKSTLTRLLLRFSDLDGGAILIDGQNIASITQDDLRKNIAYVPQEPLLFHRSIRENISYGKPEATEQEITTAAKKAYADDFIKRLPQGYDTLVGERGVKLSGGQRQRVAIARAILKDAPILILDEATSALDSESESLIQSALWELMKGRTAIVIAHRLSTIQKMDRIIVLDDGQLTEEGTHKTLLKNKGTYAKLWKHQSGGFIEDWHERS